MMNNITVAFLTSGHNPFDDRIFYHLAKTLGKQFKVIIIASTENVNETVDNIILYGNNEYDLNKSNKVLFFIEALKKFNPQIVICSEPLPIFAASKYKRKCNKKVKIIFDVTEWYPSKKNLEGQTIFKRIITFTKLMTFNVINSAKCDGFIFGEYYKSFPYKIVFPFKYQRIISYYPNLDYIHFKESKICEESICLGYTGKISVEKGILNFFEVAFLVKQKQPDLNLKLKIIGWCLIQSDLDIFNGLCQKAKNLNIFIEIYGKQDFKSFSERLQDIDILFDLRKSDFENNHCLPIKVFYYAACGKPVIYTDLKAIRREMDVNKFGYLVDPNDFELISDHVLNYTKDTALYQKHSRFARKLAEEKYNWQAIEKPFSDFIEKFLF